MWYYINKSLLRGVILMMTEDFKVIGGNGRVTLDKMVINNITYLTVDVKYDSPVIPEKFYVTWNNGIVQLFPKEFSNFFSDLF